MSLLLSRFREYLFSQSDVPSKVTVKNYLSDLNHFMRWYENNTGSAFTPSSIDQETIEQYKNQFSSTLSASSLARHLSTLRKFFKFLKEEDIVKIDIFELQKTAAAAASAQVDPWKLKEFKDFLFETNSSHLTIKNYIIDVKQFLVWAKQVAGLSEDQLQGAISAEFVQEYKKRLYSDAHFSPATVNRKLSSLRKYLNWASAEGLVVNRQYPVEGISKAKSKIFIPDQEGIQTTNYELPTTNYSSFPPLRLFQKISKGISLSFDAALILPLAGFGLKLKDLVWKMRGQPIFEKGPQTLVSKNITPQDLLGIKNISKRLYMPFNISTKYFSPLQKLIFHAHYTRPKWYKTYHSYAITHYFHFAVLVIFLAGLGFGLYNAFFMKPQSQNPALAALPTAPPRILSFQGRLTDVSDNPITSNTNMRFAIYDDISATGSALLWQEVDSVVPDTDGIFNSILGNVASIPSTLFSEHSALYLGVTIETTPELIPRQQLATVAYATNSETLQGLPPSTAAGAGTANVVLALDSSGNLTIGGSANPTFTASGGTFKLSGQPLLLTTNVGSGGNVQVVPDALGKVDVQKALVNTSINGNLKSSGGVYTNTGAVEIDDELAVLATSSGHSAFTLNQDSSGPLISASTSGTAKFTVDNSGNITSAGTINGLTVSGGTISSGTWNGTAISSTYGGTGLNTSALTGVPYVSSGTWSVDTNYLALSHGGTNNTLTANNGGIVWSDATKLNILAGTATANQCLLSGSTATPSWGSCASGTATNFWTSLSGALYPTDSTSDLLVGSNATSSAEFAFTGLGLANHQTQASISGQLIVMPNNGYGGNVGIGTTAPTGTLDVLAGTNSIKFRRDNAQMFQFTADAGSNRMYVQSAGGNAKEFVIATDTNSNGISFQTNSSGTFGNNTRMYIANGGNVGIGTTGPRTTLDVTGSASISANLAFNGSGTTHTVSTFDGGNINFDMVGGGSGAGTSALYLQKTGNVGIGTTSPGAKLDVRGNITLNSMGNKIYWDWTGAGIVDLSPDGGTSEMIQFMNSGVHAGDVSNPQGGFSFSDQDGVSLVRILQGNVGIGTTGPDSPLDVLSTGGSQIRATYTDGTVYTTFNTDSSGNLNIDATGTKTTIADDLQITGNDIINTTLSFGNGSAATLNTPSGNAALTIAPNGSGALNLATTNTGSTSIGNSTGTITLTASGITANTNSVLYAANTTLATATTASSGLCLVSGANNPTWSGCTGVPTLDLYWSQTNGALYTNNNTVDFLIGGQSSASALFAVAGTSRATGTNPIATVSGTTAQSILVVNQKGTGDIFTASTSGTSKFNITNAGALQLNGTNPSIRNTNTNSTLELSANGSGTLTLNGNTNTGNIQFFSSSNTLSSAGNLTIAGDLTITGNDITNTTLSFGNGSAATLNTPSGNAALTIAPNGSGALNLATTNTGSTSIGNSTGTITLTASGITANTNSVLYAANTTLATATTATPGQCLVSAANTPAWSACPAGAQTVDAFWNQGNGALFPNNSTVDFLVGGQSTLSAKFAVLNVNSGTPTASIAGNFIVMPWTNGAVQQGGNLGIGTNAPGSNLANLSLDAPIHIARTTAMDSNIVYEFASDAAANNPGLLGLRARGNLLTGKSIVQSGDSLFVLNAKGWDGTDGWIDASRIDFEVDGTPGDNDMPGRIAFKTTADGAQVTTERIRLASTGILGIGTTAGIGELHVTRPLSWGTTGKALGIFDQIENQDILTASKSSVPKFAVDSSGNLIVAGGTTLDTGSGAGIASGTLGIGTTNQTALTLGRSGATTALNGSTITVLGTANINTTGTSSTSIGNSTGTITLTASGITANTNSVLYAANTTLATATTATPGQCLVSAANTPAWSACPAGVPTLDLYWSQTSGALYPNNSTVDFLIGGQASSSALFSVAGTARATGTNPIATVSGTTAQAILVVNQKGTGDIFTASTSGTSKFNITNAGALQLNGTNPTIRNTNTNSTLELSANGSGTLTLNGNTNTGNIQFFSSSNTLSSAGNLTLAGTLAVNGDSITADGATLTINAAGNVDVQDALNADSITSDAGVSIAASNSYTGAGAVTLSSGGAGALTLDSASNTLIIAASDTTLTASGIATIDAAASLGIDSTTLTLGNGSAATLATTTNGLSLDSGSNTLTIAASDTTLTTSLTSMTTGAAFTINGTSYVRIGDTATPTNATGDDALFVEGNLEVDGVIYAEGTIDTLFTGKNAVVYGTETTGVLASATTVTGSQCLLSGASAPAWATCPGGAPTYDLYWSQSNGALYTNNNTVDLLFGGQATTSATFRLIGGKFQGTDPVATIAASTSFAALVVDNDARGDLITASNSGVTRFVVRGQGNVGIGGTIPISQLYVTRPLLAGATGKALAIFDQIENQDIFAASKSGTTQLYLSNVGNLNTRIFTDLDNSAYFLDPAAAVTSLNIGGTTITASNLTTFTTAASLTMDSTTTLTLGGDSTINGGSAANNDLTLQGTSNATRTTSYVILQPTAGNVGIGTTLPGKQLEISKTVLASDTNENSTILRLLNPDTSGTVGTPSRIGIGFGGTTTRQAIIGGTFGNDYLDFFTTGDLTTPKVRISSTGNVGLGTTDPKSELHVTRPLSFGATGKALAIFDQIENQDMLTASSSGATMFTVKGPTNAGIELGRVDTNTTPYIDFHSNSTPTDYDVRIIASGGTGGDGGGTLTVNSTSLTLSGDLAINGGNITTALTADSTLTVTGALTAKSDIYLTKGASSFIGGTDNFDLRFGVNTTEYMRITTAGNVALVGDLAIAGSNIDLTNATSNRIDWNLVGNAVPTFTSYSAGVKLVLYDNINASTVGYTIGTESNYMFFTTGQATNNGFKWYGGTTEFMRIGTAGTVYMPGLATGTNNRAVCALTTSTPANQLFVVNAACTTSSRRYKHDIQDLDYGLADIMKLKPVSFVYNDFDPNKPDGRTAKRIGFIAEDMINVIPEVVLTDSLGRPETIDYPNLTALNTKGIQQLQLEILDNQNRIASMEADLALNNAGNLTIVQNNPDNYSVVNSNNETTARIAALAELVVGNIRAGLISTQKLIVSGAASIGNLTSNTLNVTTDSVTIAGLSLRNYITQVVNDVINSQQPVVSPISSADQIGTNVINPLSENSKISLKLEKDKLSIINDKNASGAAVASFDNKGNATFSGTLSAQDSSISGTLRARRIIADQIEGLNIQASTVSANYITNVTNIYNSTSSAANPFPTYSASPSGQSTDYNLPSTGNFISIATFSSQLAYVENLSAANAVFNQGLMVFGPTTLSDTSVVGQLSVNGSLILSDNSINVLGGDLNLQPLRQGGISIMAGLIYIDVNGNVKIGKDATIEGTLYANAISPLPGKDLSINLGGHNSSFIIHNSSSSGVLAIDNLGNLIASGAGTFAKLNIGSLLEPALALSANEVVATGSAGTITLKANKTEVTVNNKLVTENSLIYITPVGATQGQSLYLLRQVAESQIEGGPEGSFTVGISLPVPVDVKFNFLIIN